MTDFWKKNLVLTVFLILSVIAALFSCARRWSVESEDRSVAALMPREGVLALAAADGRSEEDWLRDLRDAGVTAILLSENAANDPKVLSALEEAGLRPAVRSDDPRQVREGFFPALFPIHYPSGQNLERLQTSGIPLVLTEGAARLGAVLPDGYLALLDQAAPAMVKCIELNGDLASRYAVYGYPGAKEIENVLFRAVTDRSVRIMLLAPFLDGGKIVADPAQYKDVLSGLSARIAARGLTLGAAASYPARTFPGSVALFIIYLGLFALAVGLLNSIVSLRRRANFVLFALGALVSTAFAFLFYIEPGRKLMALAAAIVFPCAAVWLLIRLLRGACPGGSRRQVLSRFALSLLLCAAVGALGGLYVGAILGSTDYLLELRHFSGVKASQFLPLVYSAYILFVSFYHEKGRGLRGDFGEIMGRLRGRAKAKLVLAAAALVIILAVFILRTGESFLSASALEIRARNLLENVLYARPRTKEFLIAFPLLALAVLSAARGWKNALWPCAFIASIGFCSITNSFCHIRAPLALSLMRTLISAALGLIIGAALLIVIDAVFRRRRC